MPLLATQQALRVTEMIIDSEGGDVAAALAMGWTVRHMAMDVYVPTEGYCTSACVFVLAGGVRRGVDIGVTVGVHQFSGGAGTATGAQAQSAAQSLSGRILEHMTQMGIDPQLMVLAMQTPPDQLRVLSIDEMRRYRLISY